MFKRSNQAVNQVLRENFMMTRNRSLLLLAALLLIATPRSQAQSAGDEAAIIRAGIPKVLSLRERGEVVNRWLM